MCWRAPTVAAACASSPPCTIPASFARSSLTWASRTPGRAPVPPRPSPSPHRKFTRERGTSRFRLPLAPPRPTFAKCWLARSLTVSLSPASIAVSRAGSLRSQGGACVRYALPIRCGHQAGLQGAVSTRVVRPSRYRPSGYRMSGSRAGARPTGPTSAPRPGRQPPRYPGGVPYPRAGQQDAARGHRNGGPRHHRCAAATRNFGYCEARPRPGRP
jgi:hypothetical protein